MKEFAIGNKIFAASLLFYLTMILYLITFGQISRPVEYAIQLVTRYEKEQVDEVLNQLLEESRQKWWDENVKMS